MEALRCERLKRHQINPPFRENREARFPQAQITAEENVTNRLAEQFYRNHGVEAITQGWDLKPSLIGARGLQTSYCIRREIGECLRERSKLKEPLLIRPRNS